MSFPEDDHDLDKVLAEAYAPPPTADFEAWRSRHTEAVACLDPQRIAALTRRRITVKRAFQVLAATIVGSAAVLGFVLLWGGSAVQPVSAMEKMAENVRKAKSYKYSVTGRTTSDRPDSGKQAVVRTFTGTSYWLAPGSTRRDHNDRCEGRETNTTEIFPAGKPGIWIDHVSRKFCRQPPQNGNASAAFDDLERLGRFSGAADRELGTKEINGKKARGFQIEMRRMNPEFDRPGLAAIWIDTESNLPVLVCYEGMKSMDRSTTAEISDIQWNIDLDAKLFDATPPDRYADLTPKPPTLAEQQRQIVDSFRIYAEASGGRYPPRNGDDTSEDLCKMLGLVTYPSPRETTGNAGKAVKAEKGFDQLGDLQRQNSGYAYYGRTVGPKDKDNVLLRWKLDDGRFEVIFGDLRGETVTAERLRRLEAR